MSRIIAKLEITQDEDGSVSIAGTGEPLNQKAFVYGLLELAKDIVREGKKPRVQVATMHDLPH